MIIRVDSRTNKPFVQIDKEAVNDPRLSFACVGLLTYLLSKPDDWEVSLHELAKSHSNGKTSIKKILAELGEYGYLEKKQLRGHRGEFSRCSFTIREVIKTTANQANNDIIVHVVEGSQDSATVDGFTVDRKPVNGKSDSNNKYINNNINNKNKNPACVHALISSPQVFASQHSPEPRQKTKRTSERFSEFWAAWPEGYKVGKKKCLQLWEKNNLDKMADELIADVNHRKLNCSKWLAGFVMNPATYLYGERWDDEIQTKNPGSREYGTNSANRDCGKSVAEIMAENLIRSSAREDVVLTEGSGGENFYAPEVDLQEFLGHVVQNEQFRH
ncbi:hypothetical protein COB55_05430 [Candidatus Wolfebacteria bacterium]|nr:MAG: hypothetical protein COB55_05430 [Candidatus Wolfebacteria bacterium]